jgi:hypothetical protein
MAFVEIPRALVEKARLRGSGDAMRTYRGKRP